MTRWARAEVALAAAAILVALLAGNLTGAFSAETSRSNIVPAVSEALAARGAALGNGRVDSVVARSLVSGASSEQVMNALVGPATSEWLFAATVVR